MPIDRQVLQSSDRTYLGSFLVPLAEVTRSEGLTVQARLSDTQLQLPAADPGFRLLAPSALPYMYVEFTTGSYAGPSSRRFVTGIGADKVLTISDTAFPSDLMTSAGGGPPQYKTIAVYNQYWADFNEGPVLTVRREEGQDRLIACCGAGTTGQYGSGAHLFEFTVPTLVKSSNPADLNTGTFARAWPTLFETGVFYADVGQWVNGFAPGFARPSGLYWDQDSRRLYCLYSCDYTTNNEPFLFFYRFDTGMNPVARGGPFRITTHCKPFMQSVGVVPPLAAGALGLVGKHLYLLGGSPYSSTASSFGPAVAVVPEPPEVSYSPSGEYTPTSGVGVLTETVLAQSSLVGNAGRRPAGPPPYTSWPHLHLTRLFGGQPARTVGDNNGIDPSGPGTGTVRMWFLGVAENGCSSYLADVQILSRPMTLRVMGGTHAGTELDIVSWPDNQNSTDDPLDPAGDARGVQLAIGILNSPWPTPTADIAGQILEAYNCTVVDATANSITIDFLGLGDYSQPAQAENRHALRVVLDAAYRDITNPSRHASVGQDFRALRYLSANGSNATYEVAPAWDAVPEVGAKCRVYRAGQYSIPILPYGSSEVYWSNYDFTGKGVWIEGQSKHGVVFAETLACGAVGYANAFLVGMGLRSYDAVFDPQHLVEGGLAQRDIYQQTPVRFFTTYHTAAAPSTPVEGYPGFNSPYLLPEYSTPIPLLPVVSGVAYSPATRREYRITQRYIGGQPYCDVVSVWEVAAD